jgi:DNA modification methylase
MSGPRLPVYRDAAVTAFLGDAREVLADLPAASVDCCVTSPPYWGLRDYSLPPLVWGGEPNCRHRWTGGSCLRCGAWLGSLGLEPTPELYVEHLVEVMRAVRRVLKATGTLWLNLGDCYVAKQLVGIPWRVALALQCDGWYLRCDVVWAKPNPMPESVRDRPTRAHEYLFLLSARGRYYYDAHAVMEPCVSGPSDVRKMVDRLPRLGGKNKSLEDPLARASAFSNIGRCRAVGSPTGRSARSVWTIATQSYRGAHFATFPSRLVERCIRAGTSEHGCCPSCGSPWERAGPVRLGWRPTCGCPVQQPAPAVVLDPFAGSGTTLTVAARLGRHAVGVELNPEYVDLIRERCTAVEKASRTREAA